MAHWARHLRQSLDHDRQADRLRQLCAIDSPGRTIRRNDHELLNCASNDYLALAGHPYLQQAMHRAIDRYGAGSGASRLVCGHLQLHESLEHRFAAFKHAEAALLLPTGYMANLAAITALAGEDDLLLIDKLNHASLIDAAALAGSRRAVVRVYPHGQLDKLRRLLQRTRVRGRTVRHRIIITDSVFSMDGDVADLPSLCELRDEHDAMLIVDEAHATGVLGDDGSGLAAAQGVAGCIDVTISTASKALGSLGGIVSASQLVIDTLINRARSFIYTTAVPPVQVAAIDAALDIVRDEPQRRRHVIKLSQDCRTQLRQRGWAVRDDPTPIIPLVVGEDRAALALADRVQQAGFFAPAIRPPTVAPGAARLRISLRADMDAADITRLVDAVGPPPPVN
jgi:8-amino-7-oxononanoate synthase